MYTEELVRLPTCFLGIQPRNALLNVPVSENPPFLKNGFVTFGSFNNLAKHSTATQRLWGRVLDANRSSKLLVKSQAIYEEGKKRWVDSFAEIAVDKSAPSFNFKSMANMKKRVIFLTMQQKLEDHYRCYADMDIMIDSFPYTGAITTTDALMMGVPVVTLSRPGEASIHSHNVTSSILKAVGLEDLVATNEDEFVRIAVELSQDEQRLKDLRTTLRDRCLTTICSFERLCTAMEHKFRQMWIRFLEEQGPCLPE